jgi:hypothetical protein
MRASLSLNPESFTRRFAMIPCAAGSGFQTVDVMMNAPNNASNFDWAYIFVNSSQQTSSDAEDRSTIRCANCRCTVRMCSIVCCVTACAYLTPRFPLCSHSIRLDDVVKARSVCRYKFYMFAWHHGTLRPHRSCNHRCCF